MIADTPLLEPEFKSSFEAWKKEPSPRTSTALLEAVHPVLESAIRSYGGKSPSPTLHSRAKLLALDAAGRYDPSKAKLRTHLMVNLQGLRRASAREGQIISIPERVGLDLFKLHEAENELSDRLGRGPSDLELADHTGLSRKRLEHIRKARPGYSEGQVSNVVDEEGQASMGPSVIAPANNMVWQDFVYHDLHPTDQIIMEHSLGLHGKPILSKQAIAKKLRLSPGAISQRAAKIQERLDRQDDLGVGLF